ncbi:MAG TPA: NYN domain-containing protein [Chloroflexota bacterium]|nr:NYN domain-containing protein [Chloroflexota bacterium]
MNEVAAFVDVENIRYSMLNRWHQEPNPLAWRDKARKYGLIGIARAYADFEQHPPQLRQRLSVAGFEAEHYPVKRYRDRDGSERIRSIADLHMIIDIVDTALGRPTIDTFLFFTGDGDFIRVVAMLNNRLGKRVVICGVPETTSHDLVVAAGDEDSLEVSEVVSSPEMDITLICRVDEYEQSLYGGFLPTQGNLIAWLKQRLEVGLLPSEQVDGKILEFIRQGVLYKQLETSSRGKTLTTTRLRREHPLVEQALGSGSLDGEQSAGGDETQEYRHQMPRVVSARPWAPDTRG